MFTFKVLIRVDYHHPSPHRLGSWGWAVENFQNLERSRPGWARFGFRSIRGHWKPTQVNSLAPDADGVALMG